MSTLKTNFQFSKGVSLWTTVQCSYAHVWIDPMGITWVNGREWHVFSANHAPGKSKLVGRPSDEPREHHRLGSRSKLRGLLSVTIFPGDQKGAIVIMWASGWARNVLEGPCTNGYVFSTRSILLLLLLKSALQRLGLPSTFPTCLRGTRWRKVHCFPLLSATTRREGTFVHRATAYSHLLSRSGSYSNIWLASSGDCGRIGATFPAGEHGNTRCGAHSWHHAALWPNLERQDV